MNIKLYRVCARSIPSHNHPYCRRERSHAFVQGLEEDGVRLIGFGVGGTVRGAKAVLYYVIDLAAFVGATLAPFKVPAHWEIRSEPLPRNAAGKVVKADL